MTRPALKLVVFDLDGTLVDAYGPVVRSLRFALARGGFPAPSTAVIKRSVGWGDRLLIEKFVGEENRERVLVLYRRHHAGALRHGLKFLPGALRILNALRRRGLHLAVASNRPRKYSLIILKELKIFHYFDSILCGDELKRPKPYPDILRQTLRRLKVKSSEALYVGDMILDVTTGRRAGVRTVAVATGSCTRQELVRGRPFKVIRHLKQLKVIIKEKGENMSKKKRRGKLNWRSKKANHGRKPTRG